MDAWFTDIVVLLQDNRAELWEGLVVTLQLWAASGAAGLVLAVVLVAWAVARGWLRGAAALQDLPLRQGVIGHTLLALGGLVARQRVRHRGERVARADAGHPAGVSPPRHVVRA